MRTLRTILWGLVLIVAATVSGVYVGQTFLGVGNQSAAVTGFNPISIRNAYQQAGGPFTLLDETGETITEAKFRGKPLVMFFGFTHCPDVCPTHLLDAAQWLEALGDQADDINVVFVSVDPQRDTPELLSRYVNAFDERIVGLTAKSEDDIAEIANRYGILYDKVPFQNGDYTMNHTTDTLLFDANGRYVDFIEYVPPHVRQNANLLNADFDTNVGKLRTLIAG
ncbi:MAG: SCO family protein [Pseudomonadota bacterium]